MPSAWHLWCAEHGPFWDESRWGRCFCGYRTNTMNAKDSDRHPLSAQFHSLLAEMGNLHDKKQADYGRGNDPFANVRGSEDFGVEPWVGAMIRANDKMRRIQKVAAGGTLTNEGVVDSFMDLAVYALIARILWEDKDAES